MSEWDPGRGDSPRWQTGASSWPPPSGPPDPSAHDVPTSPPYAPTPLAADQPLTGGENRPPVEYGEEKSRGRSFMLWVVVALAIIVLLLAIAVNQATETSEDNQAAGDLTTAASAASTNSASTDSAATDSAVSGESVVATTGGESTGATDATTAPGAESSAAATTAEPAVGDPSAGTAVPPTIAGPLSGVSLPAGSEKAVQVAQQLADALANGDWATARRLEPDVNLTDAEYEEGYADVARSAIVPLKASVAGARYDMRVLLVAQQEVAGAQQTSVFCARWVVDTGAGTVDRVPGSTKLGTVPGWVEPLAAASSYQNSCT